MSPSETSYFFLAALSFIGVAHLFDFGCGVRYLFLGPEFALERLFR